jgi:mRNA deadenylase 3'-5' endonuclease subunit Ccr4
MKHKTKKSSGHHKGGGKSKNHHTKSGGAKACPVEMDRNHKKNWVDDHWCWMPVPEQRPQQTRTLQPPPPPLTPLQSDPTITKPPPTTTPKPYDISIVSWNVLANSYCNPRSHRHLPLKVQRHVFDRPQRQHHVRQILRRLVASSSPLRIQADLVALQEVDEPLHVHDLMTGELEMDGIETPTTPSGTDGRIDACALYYKRSTWKKVHHQVLRLDDLATVMSTTNPGNTPSTTTTATTNTNTNTTHAPNLQGIQTSLMRNNMALLVHLQHLQNPNLQIVVVVVHLYWNPLYEYIKVRNGVRNKGG